MLVYYQVIVKEYMFYFEMIYFASSVLTKFAMAIMILRLSSRKIYSYIIWGNMVVLAINAAVCLVIMFVSCSPIPALWNEKLCVVPSPLLSSPHSMCQLTASMKWLLSYQTRLDHHQLCRFGVPGHGGLDMRHHAVLHATGSTDAKAKEGAAPAYSQLGYDWQCRWPSPHGVLSRL
jgi:hypothetical protein